jgi:addiction module RelE/StbE family toxin
MQIRFAKKFVKQYEKASIKIQFVFDNKLKLFAQNPSFPQLNNHALTGKLSGYRSINVTGDWRAIYSSLKTEDGITVITFEAIGTHSQLYK